MPKETDLEAAQRIMTTMKPEEKAQVGAMVRQKIEWAIANGHFSEKSRIQLVLRESQGKNYLGVQTTDDNGVPTSRTLIVCSIDVVPLH